MCHKLKKILGVITFSDKNAPSAPIFDSLSKVLKFNDMIRMLIVSFVYECVHKVLSPAYFSSYFTWIENVPSFGTGPSEQKR